MIQLDTAGLCRVYYGFLEREGRIRAVPVRF